MASIAVIGSGAIGLLYGAQLALAGHDVRFLLRRDYERIARDGLVIDTTPTKEIERAREGATLRLAPTAFRACREPADCARGGAPEWVLLALKTTALDDAPALLAPMIGPGTRVVAMCNGLGVEERLARHVEADRVYGAMAHVCVVRRDDGSVHHQAHGKLLLGHLRDDPARLRELAELVSSAGVGFYEAACLLEARWRKLTWNIPYNGLSVALDLETDAIMERPELRARVVALMAEVVAVANADLARAGKPARIDAVEWPLEMRERTLRMGAYATSTLLDWRAGRPLEIDAIFAEPVRRAREMRVPTPEMERLLADLQQKTRGS
jgi:2-dehydropantoate 2-reductase